MVCTNVISDPRYPLAPLALFADEATEAEAVVGVVAGGPLGVVGGQAESLVLTRVAPASADTWDCKQRSLSIVQVRFSVY